MGLGAASLVYGGVRGGSNPEVTDFKVNDIINDLTRDQTAAQNIVNTLGVVSAAIDDTLINCHLFLSTLWFIVKLYN